jgi:hypothetical protein
VAEYRVIDAESRIEISRKSSLHPVTGQFRPGHLSGSLAIGGDGGDAPAPGAAPQGHLELPITALSFGSALYGRELPKRVEASRYPDSDTAPRQRRTRRRPDLADLAQPDRARRHQTLPRDGDRDPGPGRSITVSGRHHFDVREFGIQPPGMLGMKVHPDFEVTVHAVGELAIYPLARPESRPHRQGE